MTKAHTLRTLAILATFLLLSGSAFAVGISESGDGLAWTTEKAFAGSAVSISGPGDFHISRTFDGGSTPQISLFDKAGYFWADGQYSWQLTLHPEAKVRGEDAAGQGSVFSGTFRIENGSVILPKASLIDSDRGFTKDQVILDDLIVDGSACVGQDCANGESFGFDTLRLKENNLRIKFQDTSSSGSFPSNDWQLTANDSANGGANKFSIDDIDGGRTPFTIEAATPTNALYVDSSGQIGFGTSGPVVELHVVDGDSPTLRLEQDGSAGFASQTWDLAGNETNFFVRDVSNGSKLPFKVFPNAPTDSLTIEGSTGDVGIGTKSPENAVDIVRSSAAITLLQIKNTNASPQNTGVRIDNGGASGAWDFRQNTAGQFSVNLVGTGAAIVLDDADLGVTLGGLAGSGSAYVCVDASGNLSRSSSPCV